jgi:hypothetical protein
MTDYLRSISRVSNASSNKDIKINNSILSYYYCFNDLHENVNRQMRMKDENKKLNLLGNFKIKYDNTSSEIIKEIVFQSPTKTIIVHGLFIMNGDTLTYFKRIRPTITIK